MAHTESAPPIQMPTPAIPFERIVAGAISPATRATALEMLARAMADCRRCCLHQQRQRVVPGQGCADTPDVMFVGEAPGATEDAQGLAFVGRAGQLLTKMIAAMGYTREEVFIANICKCRPPDNRAPESVEMQACIPFLKAQIAIVKPKVIVSLGATAIKGLLDDQRAISKIRGIWTRYEGIPLMPTFHPAFLLRNPSAKAEAWKDLRLVLARLGRAVPAASQKATAPNAPDAPV